MAGGDVRHAVKCSIAAVVAAVLCAGVEIAEANCIRSGTTISCTDGSSLRTLGKPGFETQTYKDRFGTFTTHQGRFQGGTGTYTFDPRNIAKAPLPRATR
jgi:hypothetical protein